MEHLYFPDLETLLRTLTSQRLALLKTLYAIGPISIRALAKALGRNYKNVHTDVQALQHGTGDAAKRWASTRPMDADCRGVQAGSLSEIHRKDYLTSSQLPTLRTALSIRRVFPM